MPGGLTLLVSANADIPTPASGKVTIYFSTELSGPAYKDDAGNVHQLAGVIGTVGPPGVGFDGIDGDFIPLPGPQGSPGPSGATGLQGPPGPNIHVEDGMDGIDGLPGSIINAGWVLIDSVTFSVEVTKDFINLGRYSEIRVLLKAVTVFSITEIRLRVSTDNGSTFLSTSGDYIAVSGAGAETATTELQFYSPASASARSGEITIHGFNLIQPKTAQSIFYSVDGVQFRIIPTASALSAIRIYNSSAVAMTGGVAYIFGR